MTFESVESSDTETAEAPAPTIQRGGAAVPIAQPVREGAASRVNYNIMKNYQSPVLTSDYVGLLQQRAMYPEPMHNDELCGAMRRLLIERLGQLRTDPSETVPNEARWLLRMYNLQMQFLLLMFPRHSAIGDVGDTMGVSCSLLVFDCMCLCLACYTLLAGGLEIATRQLTDASHPDTIRAMLSIHGPDVMIAHYTQTQLLGAWEALAKKSRDTWPTEAVVQYRWCLVLRTADLCSYGEQVRANEDGYTVMDLDAGAQYLQVEERWHLCSARFQQQVMFFLVQTELPCYALRCEVLAHEVRPQPSSSTEADDRATSRKKRRSRAKAAKENSPERDREEALRATAELADELCMEVLGDGCTFERLSAAFDKHFASTCENTNNDSFVKDMSRRWADGMVFPGAKCYAFFENKYSAAPDTSEILRFVFSVSLRTWIEHTLPRQRAKEFVDEESTGEPALADIARSMILQQMVGMHSSEIMWDSECYIDDSTAWRYLVPAYCTQPNDRGYQHNRTDCATFDLGETELFVLERLHQKWSVPIRDRDARCIPAVIRLCGGYWVYCRQRYYRCRSLCQAFVLWVLFVVSYSDGVYYRPTGDRFDMGFLVGMFEEMWTEEQSAAGVSRSRQWVDPQGRPAVEGQGILVIKKRTDK